MQSVPLNRADIQRPANALSYHAARVGISTPIIRVHGWAENDAVAMQRVPRGIGGYVASGHDAAVSDAGRGQERASTIAHGPPAITSRPRAAACAMTAGDSAPGCSQMRVIPAAFA